MSFLFVLVKALNVKVHTVLRGISGRNCWISSSGDMLHRFNAISKLGKQPGKEDQRWKIHTSQFEKSQQSYSNTDSATVAQGQTYN